MKKYWEKYATKIDALTLRERAFVFIGMIAVIGITPFILIISPLMDKQKKLSEELIQQQTNLKATQDQLVALSQVRAKGSDQMNEQRLQKLREQIATIDNELKGMQSGLVAPEKMSALLENILKRNGRLQLVQLRTLPALSLVDEKKPVTPNKETSPRSEQNIYKHGIEMTIQGGYLDLLAYITQLERLPEQMFWSKVKMDSTQYPKVLLTVTVYTLSLNKAWLVI